MQTPWGPSQTQKAIAPGIVRVITASHGGFHCTGAAQKQIERLFPGFHPWAGSQGWYEEDCDWALVAVSHPSAFDRRAVYHAVRILRLLIQAEQGFSPHHASNVAAVQAFFETAEGHNAVKKAEE